MVRTMRRVAKEQKVAVPRGNDSTRLSLELKSAADFSPINARVSSDQDGEDGGSEYLPTLNEVLQQIRQVAELDVEGAQSGDDADGSEFVSADEGYVEDEVDTEGDDSGADESNNDESEQASGGDENLRELGGAENGAVVALDAQDESDGNEEENRSSDIESVDRETPIQTTSQNSANKGKRKILPWDEPKDTERLLDLLEQFAMREHYVNHKSGGWKNNTFGKIGEKMGKEGKCCNNKYLSLKYKYVEIMELLCLGVGLQWDGENNKVYGSEEAWSKVTNPTLVKLRGRKFLYKEEFDNLNRVLEFAPILKSPTQERDGEPPCEVSVADKSGGRYTTIDASDPADQDGHGDEEPNAQSNDEVVDKTGSAEMESAGHSDDDEDVANNEIDSANSAPLTTAHGLHTAAMTLASVRRRPPNKKWFDSASIHTLVKLLVEYMEDDYYIAPICKTWKNGVFAEIAAKIGKTQGLCQSKYATLRDTYVDLEKLLQSNLGFEWDAGKAEVVGSNAAWAKVRDQSLRRRRHCKFPFREEFAKLATKLNFERREYAPKHRKRSRTSARISGSPPNQTKPLDEVEDPTNEAEQPADGEDAGSEMPEDTDEPPRKKRLLSNTYEKRRNAFYAVATTVSSKRAELKAIMDAQLVIQRKQIAALHAQILAENKLSQSLEECHVEDARRRSDMEDLQARARHKLQDERCLTPRGQLAIMQTLPDLENRSDGYLGVMMLQRGIRQLWLKSELHKLSLGDLEGYFIETDDQEDSEESKSEMLMVQQDESTLVDQDIESGEDELGSARSVCENDDSAVAIGRSAEGSFDSPADDASIKECEKDALDEEAQHSAEADAFEIDPYISVENIQDD